MIQLTNHRISSWNVSDTNHIMIPFQNSDLNQMKGVLYQQLLEIYNVISADFQWRYAILNRSISDLFDVFEHQKVDISGNEQIIMSLISNLIGCIQCDNETFISYYNLLCAEISHLSDDGTADGASAAAPPPSILIIDIPEDGSNGSDDDSEGVPEMLETPRCDETAECLRTESVSSEVNVSGSISMAVSEVSDHRVALDSNSETEINQDTQDNSTMYITLLIIFISSSLVCVCSIIVVIMYIIKRSKSNRESDIVHMDDTIDSTLDIL